MTLSWYDAGCSSNHSRHGIETTRARTPSPARRRTAVTATAISDPVARTTTSGSAAAPGDGAS
ncbi:hypothetical protein OG370_34485 [Streptomyces sp. NBC_00448]